MSRNWDQSEFLQRRKYAWTRTSSFFRKFRKYIPPFKYVQNFAVDISVYQDAGVSLFSALVFRVLESFSPGLVSVWNLNWVRISTADNKVSNLRAEIKSRRFFYPVDNPVLEKINYSWNTKFPSFSLTSLRLSFGMFASFVCNAEFFPFLD